jgi:kynurenine formamidase
VTVTTNTRTDNWGRWGGDDERGALNLLTPEVVLAATRACTTGRVYSLSLPIQQQGVPIVDYRNPPMRLTLTNASDTGIFAEYGAPDTGANEDFLVLASHNETHMDALCHVFHQGQMYNGYPADSARTRAGATKCGIDKTRSIVGRGVLLDLPAHQGVEHLEAPHVITGEELEACARAEGVAPRAGDTLLVRTGWIEQFLADPSMEIPSQPGLGFDACDYIRDLDIAAVGADNSAIEAIPFDRDIFLGVHIELLLKLGIPLVEHLVLTDLARDGVRECLFVTAPLVVTGGMGSPVNPIAIA